LLKWGTVSASLRHRVGRTALIGCLLLTQFQLLWMAAFHWREDLLPAAACTLAIRDAGHLAFPAGHGKTPCVVCQIIRQNAVRPGVIAPAPQLFSAFTFLTFAPSRGFHSYRPRVANGRAPPLA
jgi:hypothetical protein